MRGRVGSLGTVHPHLPPRAPNWWGDLLAEVLLNAVAGALSWVAGGTRLVYFEKIRVFIAG